MEIGRILVMNKKNRKCETNGCRNKAKKGRFCHKCNKRRWRAADPMRASYDTLRDNTKRRKIRFAITYEEFKELCYETDYIAGKGRSKLSYTLDRIDDEDPNIGYVKSNIRVITKSANSQKEQEKRRRKKILHYDWETKTANVVESGANNNGCGDAETDLPF